MRKASSRLNVACDHLASNCQTKTEPNTCGPSAAPVLSRLGQGEFLTFPQLSSSVSHNLPSPPDSPPARLPVL